MKNVTDICFADTFIEELPLSFQNLTGLQYLTIYANRKIRLPSSIFMMPKLSEITASRGRFLLPKEIDKPSSMVSTSVRRLHLTNCCLSDELLPILFTWFVNLEELVLCKHDFTILPECFKECHFLKNLYLDGCKFLRDIRGIPPNLKLLSASGCKSLAPSCRSMLLSQELHRAGSIEAIILEGTERIPKWFEHQSEGPSISFWFRNEIPSVALFFATESMHNKPKSMHKKLFVTKNPAIKVRLILNGYKISLGGMDMNGIRHVITVGPAHTCLFDLKPLERRELESKLEKELLKNEWIHAEVRYEDWPGDEVMIPFGIKSGIHIFKQKSSMEDVRFTNPSLNKKRKLDDDDRHYSQ